MWPAHHARYGGKPLGGQPSRSQPLTQRSAYDQVPPMPDFPIPSLGYERSAPVHREYVVYSPPVQGRTVADTSGVTELEPTDSRRGKDRVLRPCGNCGHMNHIRKKECERCKTPKEPPKKRVKRSKKKKTEAPRGGSSSQQVRTSSSSRSAGVHKGTHQAFPVHSDARGRGYDPSELMQGILGPGDMLPMPPILPSTSTEEHPSHSVIYNRRSSDFNSNQSFDGNYRSFHHP